MYHGSPVLLQDYEVRLGRQRAQVTPNPSKPMACVPELPVADRRHDGGARPICKEGGDRQVVLVGQAKIAMRRSHFKPDH